MSSQNPYSKEKGPRGKPEGRPVYKGNQNGWYLATARMAAICGQGGLTGGRLKVVGL